MKKTIEKKEALNEDNNSSKLLKIMNQYLKEHYKNLKNIDISSRIIVVNICMQLIKDGGNTEYRIYIEPIDGLPQIKIKNPGVFLCFCNIHNFFPVINKIYIKNINNELDFTKIKEFSFLIRLFHLFFFKGYDYVLYDIIRHYLKQENIKEIFENNNIKIPSQAELLYLLKLVEDIKKSSFDIPRHTLSEKLIKLNNLGTYRENIFLELSMKYENIIRDRMGFASTYLKPASFEEDSNQKTDFILTYLLERNKFRQYKPNHIPIQYTTGNSNSKIEKVEQFFLNQNKFKKFIYLQINGTFKKSIMKMEKEYKNWILNKKERSIQSPEKFPFFINTLTIKRIKIPIIMYFALHYIINPQKKIDSLGEISGINFSKVNLKSEEQDNKTINIVLYRKKIIGKIILWNK